MAAQSEKHLRSTPSPSTPSSTSPALFSVLELLNYPYLLLVGFPSMIISIISYLTSPVPYPAWTLSAALDIQWRKVSGGPTAYFLPPLPPANEEWSIPITQNNTTTTEERAKIDIKTVQVHAVPKELQQKGMTICPDTESLPRPGFWVSPQGLPKGGDERAGDGEKVILHLHGGGYVRGHPLWIDAPHGFALTLRQRLFSMNYRKCLSSDTAFPAPLLDALAGYIYLTQTLGFSADSITLIGESAGAHLCLILSRHLADLSLPQPGSMVLIAPWSDFTMDPSNPQGTYVSNSKYDFLLPDRLHMGALSATRHYTPEAIRSVYFSPALATSGEWEYLKKEGVRVMVAYGTREVFKDECEAVVKGMLADGVDVTAHIDEDGYHARVSIEALANKRFRKDLLEWSRRT